MTRHAGLLFAICLSALRSYAAISGVVMTSDGTPVSGARVAVHAFESEEAARTRLLSASPERPALATTTTDAKGTFTLPSPSLAVVDLAIEARGFEPFLRRVEGDGDTGAVALVRAEMRKGTVRAGGKPVPGALVAIDYGSYRLVVRTDADGRYEVPDPKRARRVIVRHPDYALDEEDWSMQTVGASKLNRTLTAGATLTGSVRDANGGGVAGAAILLDGWPLTTSAENGTFTIAKASPRWSNVTARKDGWAGSQKRTTGEVLIRLSKTATISGRALDSRTKTAVQGAVVRVGPRRTPGGSDDGTSVETDRKGVYSVAVLPGSYTVTGNHPGYEMQPVDVAAAAGETSSRELSLDPLAIVSGLVMDEDRRPVAAAFVKPAADQFPRRGMRMRDDTTVSGPDGRFTARVVVDGGVHLTAAKKGFPVAKSDALDLTPGERTTGVVLTIPTGIAVSGRVTDASGNPLSGIGVTTSESESGGMMRMAIMIGGPRQRGDDVVRTASDGTYTLRVREGTYDFHFRGEGFAPKSVRGQAVTLSEPRTVDASLEPAAEITGRVTRAGTPVADARVLVFAPGVDAMTTTAPDGSFTLGDLAAGTVRINVRKEMEFVDEMRNITAPARDVVIEIPPGGRVTGRVVEKGSKKAIPTFQAGITTSRGGGGMVMMAPPRLRDFNSEDGAFTLENVPAGSTVVVASAPGYAASRMNVTVEEGKTTGNVELELDPGVRLVGKVTSSTGTPLSDVRVGIEPSVGGTFSTRGMDRGATTDANGEYVLDGLEAGEETLVFSHPRYAATSKTVTLKGSETRLDVQLNAGRTVSGTVVTDSGAPVPDADVQAVSASGSVERARTNATGTFVMESMSEGRYRFSASSRGYADGVLEDFDISSGAPLRITLRAGATIQGRVTGLTPQELSGATVTARVGRTFANGAVDSTGAYRIEGVPAGTAQVSAAVMTASMSNRRTSGVQTVDVSPGGSHNVDLAFRADVVLRGRVTRNGSVVSDANLSFVPSASQSRASASTTTDAQGQYSVSGLEEGEYTVFVTDMQRMSPYTTTVQVSGSTSFDIDYTTSPLRGRVVDASSSEPLANTSVQLRSAIPQPAFRMARVATTDANGTFAFDAVAPGSYVMTASKEGFGSDTRDVTVSESPDPIELKLSRNDGVLLRTVDARDNRPVNATLFVFDVQGRLVHESRAFLGGPATDADTRIPLAAGTYSASVSAFGYAPVNVTLRSPSQQVVGLTPGGTLELRSQRSTPVRVRLLDSNGMPYPRTGGPTSRELLPGTTPFPNIAPGTYTLQVLGDQEAVIDSKQVTVVEQQVTREEI
jgi:uncharacterized GH25 family protein